MLSIYTSHLTTYMLYTLLQIPICQFYTVWWLVEQLYWRNMLHVLEILKKSLQKSWQRYHRTMTNLHTRKGLIFFTISARIALFTCALLTMYVLEPYQGTQIFKSKVTQFKKLNFLEKIKNYLSLLKKFSNQLITIKGIYS